MVKKKNKRSINFRNLFNQSIVIQLAILLGRVLPHEMGLKISSFIGNCLGKNKKSPMVKAIRANQYVIHNKSLSEEELIELPKVVFRSAANCIFDYFYFLSRPEKLQDIVHFSPQAQYAFDRIIKNKPTVFVCPHISNFDLMGYALSLNNYIVQVLSYPQPVSSYKMQNKLRESLGMIVTPMTLGAFREARKRLKNGGSILTGLDRPLPEEQQNKYQPTFFGHKANLPVTYVRMAIEADAPVIVVAATSQPDGSYRLESSEPLWMETSEDLETEIIDNANKVLHEAESLIKRYYQQWAMFYPIWPEYFGV
jgi:KDO2-lipid IV(A) lauroyltransferase